MVSLWNKLLGRIRATQSRSPGGSAGAAHRDTGLESALVEALRDLPEDRLDRIKALANFRDDSFARTLQHVVSYAGLLKVPRNFKHFMLPRQFSYETLELEGTNNATITLTNGRKLTGYRSNVRMQKIYSCLSDKLPRDVDAETYETYIDAYSRYEQAVSSVLLPMLPKAGTGGVFVDAGAYIGFKAIAYADFVGPGGRAILIEIDPQNEALARRNIEQNDLKSRVQSFCCAVWKENGVREDRWRDRSAHTLADTDEHDYCGNRTTMVTRTLDSILSEAGVARVDLLNLQLNGAEPEAVDGLVEYFDKVRLIRAAGQFHSGGTSMKEVLVPKLKARGCWVTVRGNSVLAVPPAFQAELGVRV